VARDMCRENVPNISNNGDQPMEKTQIQVEMLRNITRPKCYFTDHFKGFEKVDIVKQIFAEGTEETLQNLPVEFTNCTLYMRVDNETGHLLINPEYFGKGDTSDIYLDIIHELVHVKQFMEGKTSNKEQNYVQRPLEIEAYKITVNEARALGIDEAKILDYLDSDLVNEAELRMLAETLGINQLDTLEATYA
jgi:hypothetical protein